MKPHTLLCIFFILLACFFKWEIKLWIYATAIVVLTVCKAVELSVYQNPFE